MMDIHICMSDFSRIVAAAAAAAAAATAATVYYYAIAREHVELHARSDCMVRDLS
jgi:hypothetical protein